MSRQARREFRYTAFLSYRTADRRQARWLHRSLEGFRVPRDLIGKEGELGRVPDRVGRVFRDRDEARTAADIETVIAAELAASEHLIVLCTPRATEPGSWVGREISLFRKQRPGGRILAVIGDGEPPACFPPELTSSASGDRVQPLAADLRPRKKGGGDTPYKAIVKIVAALIGVRFDDLWQRAKRRRLLQTLAASAGAATLLIASIVVLASWPDPPRFEIEAADGNRVFFGPDRRTVRLPIAGLAVAGADARPSLVAEGGELPLSGWQIELRRRDERLYADITAPVDLEGLEERRARLWVRGGTPEYSQVMRLVFLGATAWNIERVFVDGLREPVLDPRDTKLLVAVDAGSGHLAQVRVEHVGGTTLVARASGHQFGDRQVYEVAFADFPSLREIASGRHTFRAHIRDRADGTKQEDCRLDLDTRDLSLGAQLEGCLQAGDANYVVATPSVRLRLAANRAIDWLVTAKKSDGTPLHIEQAEVTRYGSLLSLPPPTAAEQMRYRASLLITARDRDIWHATGPQNATAKLNIDYDRRELRLQAAADDVKWVADNPSQTFYTSSPRVRLLFERDAVRAELRLALSDSHGTELLAGEVLSLDTADRQEKELELPADGEYICRVRAGRLLGPDRAAPAEWTRTLRIVLDRSPPTVALTGPDQLVVRGRAASDWSVGLSVRDSGSARQAPPTLRARVTGPGTSYQRQCEPGPLSLADIGLDGELADGSYELEVSGADAAGNPVEAVRYSWEVARSGPSLDYRFPSDGIWRPQQGNLVRVAVGATDGNGVALVSCAVENVETGAMTESHSLDDTGTGWVGDLSLPSEFSGTRAVLVLFARDAYGNTVEERTAVMTIDKFEVKRPVRVEVIRKGESRSKVAHMVLVEGGLNYDFGGRDEATEMESFAAFGVPAPKYKRPSAAKGIPEMPAFYVDETEVTVEQFAAFLTDIEAGAEFATCVGAPKAYRHRSAEDLVTDVVGGRAPQAPVTGIDYFEASAYAHWAGKALPSVQQWEYAVRGGHAYRPLSCADASRDWSDLRKHLNVEGEAPWPVQDGADITPDGVRNLCSNVSEWASNGAGRACAAGASFDDQIATVYFNKIEPVAVTLRSDYLGFRCVVDAERMDQVRSGKDTKLESRKHE
ncbi:MAG: SUMF1/EgtB/PvdO family nonheme iron enzyme [Planctomycetota bacterium]